LPKRAENNIEMGENMKKIIYFLLIMILAVSLVFVSCDNEPENNGTNNNESSENTDNTDNNDSGDGGDNEDSGELVNVIASEDYFRVYNEILYLSYDNDFELPASFTIPSQINGETYTTIGKEIFEGRDEIVSVTIPDCVEEIGAEAFSWCENLKSVTIPDSVKEIGNCCFQQCPKLESISADGATSIGSQLCKYCTSLKNVSFNSVTEIPYEAFTNCESLVTTSFPKVKIVAGSVFSGCSSLESISFPLIEQFSGDYSFNYCTSLVSICIGLEVECEGTYYCNIDLSENDSHLFDNCSNLVGIYVPSASVETFKNDPSWGTYAEYIKSDTDLKD